MRVPGLGLSHFKKIHEDEHSATLKHPDGHEVKISKASLAPHLQKTLSQLPKHFDEGGGVSVEAEPQAPQSFDIEANSQTADNFKVPQESMSTPSPEADRSPGSAPEYPPAQNMPAAPIDYSGPMQREIGKYSKAAEAEASAQGQLGKQQAALEQENINKQEDFSENYKSNLAKLTQEHDSLQQDIANNHIDPSHYINNKSNLGKVSTAIGLLFGGIGGGLTHQANPALAFLNANIDRDIESQKADLGKKENLLSANLRQFGNLKDATEMTRLNYAGITAAKMRQAASQIVDPIARAQAEQKVVQFEMPYVQQMQKLSYMRTLNDQVSQGKVSPDQYISQMRVMDPERAKEMESRYVPGVGLSTIPIEAKTREEITGRSDLQNQVHNLRTWAQNHSGNLNPSEVAYGHALASQVQDAYRRANGQGVFREAESNFVKGIVEEDPSKFLNSLRVDPKYKALEESNFNTLNNLKRSVGLPSQQRAQEPQFQTRGGVRYQKVPGGWKKA